MVLPAAKITEISEWNVLQLGSEFPSKAVPASCVPLTGEPYAWNSTPFTITTEGLEHLAEFRIHFLTTYAEEPEVDRACALV